VTSFDLRDGEERSKKPGVEKLVAQRCYACVQYTYNWCQLSGCDNGTAAHPGETESSSVLWNASKHDSHNQ
jgi:hypothetical protein